MLTYICHMTWTLLIALILSPMIVFLAVYLTFRQYHRQQLKLQLIDSRKIKDSITLPLKLQAYERLILLCERIDFADLMLRIIAPGTSARELQSAMLIAVQQEYEHNLTQQLYITPELWQVLLSAKGKTMDVITHAGEGLDPHASAEEFASKLMAIVSQESSLPSHIGKKAIKTESSLWL